MEEFIAYLVKNLVSNPNDVTVTPVSKENVTVYEIRCRTEDAGKVIGRKGNTINALRTITQTVGVRVGCRIQLELVQDEKKAPEISPEEAPQELVEATC